MSRSDAVRAGCVEGCPPGGFFGGKNVPRSFSGGGFERVLFFACSGVPFRLKNHRGAGRALSLPETRVGAGRGGNNLWQAPEINRTIFIFPKTKFMYATFHCPKPAPAPAGKK